MLNGHWDSHHSLLDFNSLAGDTGQIIRPWLTVLVDRYSRCIVGFSLHPAPPSGEAVLDAVRMGIKRKDEILAQLGGITNSWECHGVPAGVTTDAGRASRSEELLAVSEVLQFSFHFKPLRQPWLKGQIESWFDSLERPADERGRALSFSETSWIVTKWIVDIYQQRPDPALGCTPAQMWNSGLQERPILRIVPNDFLKRNFRPTTRGIDSTQGHRPLGSGSLEF